MKAADKETGIAIRFIRQFDAADGSLSHKLDTYFDSVLVSCATLGHSWNYNPDDQTCQICGATRLDGK